MNHSFAPSVIDATKCGKCKFDIIAHTNMASCESCNAITECEIHMTMLMCPDCITKEKDAWANSQKPEEIQKRIVEVTREVSSQQDYSIKVREDIFNAETVSIIELKKSIDEDDTITNKAYILAEEIKNRIIHFSKVIFDKQQEISEEATKQRATQTYLNTLVDKLRLEEREKLKLDHIEYTPQSTFKVSKPRSVGIKKGYDKQELAKWANFASVPVAVLQMICIAKNMTPELAANHLKSINK